MINTLINLSEQPIATLVLAHGAGAGQNSDFMQFMADSLSQHHINVVRFNFIYMQLAEELGKRRPPDRAEKLLSCYQAVLDEVDQSMPLFIGGKSMGGRMASLLLEDSSALGCICMGYPFHPPGKPEKLRTEHLINLTKPLMVLQGERDTFGRRGEIEQYDLSETIELTYLKDGDHSFKPRKSSGVSLEQNLDIAVKQVVSFIKTNLPR